MASVVPFLLLAFSIGIAMLLIPIEIVRVQPIVMTRTELARATMLSIKTQIITEIEYLTTVQTRFPGYYGSLTQIVTTTVTKTATTTVISESTLTKTEAYTTSGTTKGRGSYLEDIFGDGVMDLSAKIVSLVSGMAGIVSFILKRREGRKQALLIQPGIIT